MFAYVPWMPNGGAPHSDREATEMTRKCVRSSLLLPQLAMNNWTIRFYLYCVRIVSWCLTDENNVASFAHACRHRFSKRKEKVLKLKLLPPVLEKAWLSLHSSCFAWKLVHQCMNLRIIVIKKLRPSPAGSPQIEYLLVREVHWWDTVAQSQVSFLGGVLSVLYLICP